MDGDLEYVFDKINSSLDFRMGGCTFYQPMMKRDTGMQGCRQDGPSVHKLPAQQRSWVTANCMQWKELYKEL
jgi:hypothetical protein